MTLIIAGYEHVESTYSQMFPDSPKREIGGIYAISDSAITAPTVVKEEKSLLDGFQKIYRMEASLLKPLIGPGGRFKGRAPADKNYPVAIGFAGSTLTAQHALNIISEHLRNLKINFYPPGHYPSGYNVIFPCEKDWMAYDSHNTEWDPDIFRGVDYDNLLSGELISNCIEHSITHALRSTRKYIISREDYEYRMADFMSAYWCPKKRVYELYVYYAEEREERNLNGDDVIMPHTQKRLVDKDKLVVLGLKREFENDAQIVLERALAAQETPSKKMMEFMINSIEEIKKSGRKCIDFPIWIANIDDRDIKIKKFNKK